MFSTTFIISLYFKSVFLISTFSYITVKDSSNRITGYFNDTIYCNIPNSLPIIVEDGSETPPIGYFLPQSNYKLSIGNFLEDTIHTIFYAGNNVLMYEKFNSTQTQSDKLFYDGGLMVQNSDEMVKIMNLSYIIENNNQKKFMSINSIHLSQNDSTKIINLDSNRNKFINYGVSKQFDIEIDLSSDIGYSRFVALNITIPANSSHIFVPQWTNLNNSQLIILEDLGNTGTISDTIYVNNQFIGIENKEPEVPTKFSLSQNYPNPFNPLTKIRYTLPKNIFVKLKIFDILGKEIETLVNEKQSPGTYEATFDASKYPSGVYFYKLETENYSETKKMVLIK